MMRTIYEILDVQNEGMLERSKSECIEDDVRIGLSMKEMLSKTILFS